MIYSDFKGILVPEVNGKQNPDVSYANKYQNSLGCSYSYKLLCAHDQFSYPFKSYLGEDSVYKFISKMDKKSKYLSHVIKKTF